jgi:hypothetical protein
LQTDWWLELENTYEERIKQRRALFVEHGDAVLQALPGSELACKELMEMVLQFLCARYPQYFTLINENKVFRNGISKTETDLTTTSPLHVLLNNVPEDFALMLRDDKTGKYIFRAGIICSALGWNVGTKINLDLQGIHNPIPDYNEKMAFSMNRYASPHSSKAPTRFFSPVPRIPALTLFRSQKHANNTTDTSQKNQQTNPSNAAPGA